MDWLTKYKKEISRNLVPLYQVMGNEVLVERFDNNVNKLYEYCVKNKVRWEDVLEYKEIPGAIY